MALSATIVAVGPTQADGSKDVTIRYDGPNGYQFILARRLDAATDPQVWADDYAPRVEELGRFDEARAALAAAIAGVDPHTLTYRLISIDEMRAYVLRDLTNRTGSFAGWINSQQAQEIVNANAAFVQVLDDVYGLSNAQVAAYMDPSPTPGGMNGWRNWMGGLGATFDTYVQAIDEQEPDLAIRPEV